MIFMFAFNEYIVFVKLTFCYVHGYFLYEAF